MAQDDWQRGRHQGGYEYGNKDFNDGARERRKEQAFQDSMRRDRPQPTPPPPPPPYIPMPMPPAVGNVTSGRQREPSGASGAGRRNAPGSGLNLAGMAKGTALLGALAGAAYALERRGGGWAAVMLYGGLGAGAGAALAAAVYVAIKITVLAFKIAAGLLVIGVLLHLLGVIDLPHVLGMLMHTIRR